MKYEAYYHPASVFIFPRSAPSSPDVSPQSSPRPPRANNDRLTLLTRLVRKGEKKGLFVEKMPASIYQVKWHQAACVGEVILTAALLERVGASARSLRFI